MISIGKDETTAIPRQPDGDAFYVHCTGGFRGAKSTEGRWVIEPILYNGRPCRSGFISTEELQMLARKTGFSPIAFQSMGWTNGKYHSHWIPLIPGRQNQLRGPSDLWRSISSNLSRNRSGSHLSKMENPTHKKIADLLDDRAEEERLAQSISLSLRSMDISIEQVAEYHNEQLVNLLASGKTNGERVATTLDETLFAHVHSFFMHFGAARDYFGALIASRIGKSPQRFDSMAKLVDALRPEHFSFDKLLELLRSRKFIQPSAKNSNRWEMYGWLKEASELRNEFVHRRPYGSKFMERAGCAVSVRPEFGLFRYFRPIVIDGNAERDVLDVVTAHYKAATTMFQDAAEVSGYDASILTLTDKDVISMKVTRR